MFPTPTARIAADSVVFNTKTQRRHVQQRDRHRAARRARRRATAACSATLEPDVYFYGADDREDRPRQVPHHEGRLHHLRAADAALGDRQRQRHDQPRRLRRCCNNAVVEVKDVPVFYLPVLYYPIQEDDRATGFLMPMYGIVARDRVVDQQRVLLGDQPQPGRHVLPRLDVLARQRRRRRVPLHARRRRRRATSGTTGSTRRKRSSTAQHAPAAAEQDDARRPQPEPAVRPGGARARRLRHRRHGAADSTTTTSTTPRTARGRIDGGVSGAWRNLSVNGTFDRTESFTTSTTRRSPARRPDSPRR